MNLELLRGFVKNHAEFFLEAFCMDVVSKYHT